MNAMIDIRSRNFSRYFVNTSWTIAERVIRMLVSLFVGILVARYLGPEHFGLLSYAISFVALFSSIATLGLDEIVIRDLVETRDPKDAILGTSFVLKSIGVSVLILVVCGAMDLTSSEKYTNALMMIVVAGSLFQPLNVFDLYFQSQVLAKFTSSAQFFSLILSSTVRILLIAFKAPLVWFAWAVFLENAILGIGLFVIYHKQDLGIRSWRFSKDLAAKLLHNSWPLMLSGMAIMIYMRIDQVMIKEMLNNEAAGNYAVAVRLSEAFYFIPMAVCSSLFPAIIDAKKVGPEVYTYRLQKLYDLMVWLAVAVAIPTTFLAEHFINLLLGAQYTSAAGVLRIHVWAGVFVFSGVASGKWLVAENLQHYSFYRTLAGAAVNVMLNLILIPLMGINGAALATVVSYCAAAYLSMAFFKHTRETFRLVTKSLNPIGANKRVFHG